MEANMQLVNEVVDILKRRGCDMIHEAEIRALALSAHAMRCRDTAEQIADSLYHVFAKTKGGAIPTSGVKAEDIEKYNDTFDKSAYTEE